MPKIKDNVDLKELEKFGFEYNTFEEIYEREFTYKEDVYKDWDYHRNLIAVCNNKEITCYEDFDDDYRLATHLEYYINENIQDLIKAGLVEKEKK